MLKKIIFLVIFLGGLFFPLVSLAGFYQADGYGVCYNGLVPCGKDVCLSTGFDKDACDDLLKEVQDKVEEDIGPNEAFKEVCKANGSLYSELYPEKKELRCQLCHFFVMLDGIIEFAIKFIVIPVAVLMLVVGGIMFFFAGGYPALLTKAKSLITSVIIGLVIIFAAYMIVGALLTMIGLADTNPIKGWVTGDVFIVDCPIKLSQ